MTSEQREFWKEIYKISVVGMLQSSDNLALFEQKELPRRHADNAVEALGEKSGEMPNCSLCAHYSRGDYDSNCMAQLERPWEERYGSLECYKLFKNRRLK